MNNRYTIQAVHWQQSMQDISSIREQVFIIEQHVPAELEWDGEDESGKHILALHDDDGPVGTGRILPNGHIGRMAVLKAHRHNGVGSAMLAKLLDIAQQQGNSMVFLHAQTNAKNFYDKFQFVSEGEIFMDAGIPHVKMTKELKPSIRNG